MKKSEGRGRREENYKTNPELGPNLQNWFKVIQRSFACFHYFLYVIESQETAFFLLFYYREEILRGLNSIY